ncbi:hypothetical protein H2203_005397 [Taxawa tesnikishii (nom. ined.)]|nr:hypothetical protein H2203_005397 [Dothideales sp. JES 119]
MFVPLYHSRYAGFRHPEGESKFDRWGYGDASYTPLTANADMRSHTFANISEHPLSIEIKNLREYRPCKHLRLDETSVARLVENIAEYVPPQPGPQLSQRRSLNWWPCTSVLVISLLRSTRYESPVESRGPFRAG